MNKPKILMVGMYPRQDGKPGGGPESVAEVLAAGLADSGAVDICVLTSVKGLKHAEFRQTASGVSVYTVPEFGILGASTGYFIDKRRIRKALKEINPDLVHVQGIGWYAYAALERGYPSILAIRGIGFRELPHERGYLALQRRLAVRYEYDSLKRAKHVICLNRYTFNSCAKWIRTTDVRYIDNPVDDSFFDLDLREEDGRILLLAVIRRLKSQDSAIRAIRKLRKLGKQVTLYCVGKVVEPDYYEELRQLVTQEHLEDCVVFEEHASRSAVLEHYARSAVVVVPSLVENAPLVVSEAMSAGKAIVATPAGGIPEMIENGKTGLIVPFEDPDAIAEAVARLLSDVDLRRNLGSAAKEAAEQRFRRSVSVRKTLEFYQDILDIPLL